MSRREVVKRAATFTVALACAVLALALALFAVDVARWRDAMPAGDVRYRVAPEDADLWSPSALLPLGVARWALGVDDDIDFRRAERAMRLARLDEETVSDPELALLRNDAQARLEAIATSDPDSKRRSLAANMLGALGLARLASETQDRAGLLQSITSNLRLAIDLDPTNDEAKFNLELALQRSSGLEISEGAGGANPTPGGSGVEGAGAGDPGSGY